MKNEMVGLGLGEVVGCPEIRTYRRTCPGMSEFFTEQSASESRSSWE